MTIAIIISGVTAFPVETELEWLLKHPGLIPGFAENWVKDVYIAIKDTNQKYPMLSYGFDWLAFAQGYLKQVNQDLKALADAEKK